MGAHWNPAVAQVIAELAIAAVLASHYAGKPVTLECVSYGRNDPTLASVFPGASDIELSNHVCGALRRPARTPEFAEAVLTVIHEARHARGDENENRVECEAARRAPAALYRWFGLSGMAATVRRVTFRPGCVRG